MATISDGEAGLSVRTKLNRKLDNYAVATGTNTYAVTYGTPYDVGSLVTGEMLVVKFTNANTAITPTLEVDGLTALTLKDLSGNNLAIGDIIAGGIYEVVVQAGNTAQINIQKADSGTWVPTFTGFSVVPSNVTARYYRIPGTKLCWCHIQVDTAGTSNATTMTVTLPFPAANTTTQKWIMQPFNNTAAVSPPAMMRTQVNSAICDCFLTTANGAWTSSGTKAINGTFIYETT